MNFHSVTIFPCDVNCRHHIGPRYYLCAPARWVAKVQLLQLSHFWLLRSKYERKMGPKTKTNTYKFTESSLVLTLVLLTIKVNGTNSVVKELRALLLCLLHCNLTRVGLATCWYWSAKNCFVIQPLRWVVHVSLINHCKPTAVFFLLTLCMSDVAL